MHVQRVAPALVDDAHFLIFLRGEGFDVEVIRLSACSGMWSGLLADLHVRPSVLFTFSLLLARITEARGALAPATLSVWFRKVRPSHDPQWYVFTVLVLFDVDDEIT